MTEVRSYTPEDNISPIIQLVAEWKKEANLEAFHMGNGDMGRFVQLLQRFIARKDADLFILESDGRPVGFMGIMQYMSPVCDHAIAKESFWFVSPAYRSRGLKLLDAAESWARSRGCRHLICTASNLASDSASRIAAVYVRHGFKEFEVDYIKGL